MRKGGNWLFVVYGSSLSGEGDFMNKNCLECKKNSKAEGSPQVKWI
jgi:hypothetical protein